MLRIGLYAIIAILAACCVNSFLNNAKVSSVTSKLMICETKATEAYIKGYQDGQNNSFDDNGSGTFVF